MSSWNEFRSPNLGLLIYKHIYKERLIRTKMKIKKEEFIIDVPKEEKISPFDAFYNDVYDQQIGDYQVLPIIENSKKFSLTTTYPGMFSGSGYAHDTVAKGDFKIGFYFDHTTGLPLIPGSSVKGVCRSVFEVDVNEKGKNYTGVCSVETIKFIFKELLENKETDLLSDEVKGDVQKIIDSISVDELTGLVKVIFGNNKNKGSDLFFDAVILKAKDVNKFLINDFITLHYPEVLKSPNPLQFLKIRPEIPIEFRFKLSDSGLWTKDIKLIFFKQVILTFGIGAKTNVGYGQFSENLIR